MKFEALRVEEPGYIEFRLRLDDADVVAARFDGFDRALIAECDSADASISDRLLALETIARRVEQADVAGWRCSVCNHPWATHYSHGGVWQVGSVVVRDGDPIPCYANDGKCGCKQVKPEQIGAGT